MGRLENALYIIQGEVSLLVTAMRRNSRWMSTNVHQVLLTFVLTVTGNISRHRLWITFRLIFTVFHFHRCEVVGKTVPLCQFGAQSRHGRSMVKGIMFFVRSITTNIDHIDCIIHLIVMSNNVARGKDNIWMKVVQKFVMWVETDHTNHILLQKRQKAFIYHTHSGSVPLDGQV